MRKHFLTALAVAFLAAWLSSPAAAQVVVGAAGGATFVVKDGEVINVGSILGEIETQFAWGTGEIPKHYGALVGFVGLNSEGGGEQVGLGYRHYIHAGGVYPGFGLAAFALGTDTPTITELSFFGGPELLLEIATGSDEGDGDKITGFLGFYPSLAGQGETTVIRAGIRAALN